MSSPVRKLLEDAKRLAKEDRALLRAELDRLDDDVPPQEVDAAWDEEIAARLQSIKDGTAVLYEHDDVMRELKEIVKR